MQTSFNSQQEIRKQKEEIISRIEALGLTQRYFAIFHRRKPQQITQALNGEQPGLLKRILSHIEKLEQKKKAS